MERRISLVTLGVKDVGKARAFYETLGWTGESPDGEVVFFQAGAMVFALWDRSLLASDSAVSDNGGWGGITLAHNVGSPSAVDAVLAEATAAGATIGRKGAPTFWGGYSGVFIDLAVHAWEVAHNPGWTISADSSIHLHLREIEEVGYPCHYQKALSWLTILQVGDILWRSNGYPPSHLPVLNGGTSASPCSRIHCPNPGNEIVTSP